MTSKTMGSTVSAKNNARAWGADALKGVVNVTVPSYTTNFRQLNEAGIRHDIELHVSNGFAGTLLVSEVAIGVEEYGRFCAVAHEQAAGRLMIVSHAAFGTLADNIEATRLAAANGAALSLLTYPPSFYAETLEQIRDYTRAFCDAVETPVMLFPLPTWGFGRVHNGDMPVSLLRGLLDDCPNIVAIKAEAGYPNVMGYVECHRHFHDEVVVSCPIEADMIALSQILPIHFSATSNTEYYGPMIPRIFNLLQAGQNDAATALYWQIQPARKANGVAAATWVGTGLINRLQWKYQAWLSGYNGGALRQPSMRVSDELMRVLRQGLVKSGLPVTELHDREFFVGRHPS
jgi:4-hydroxy-tetrahydrodipicolinate synthase